MSDVGSSSNQRLIPGPTSPDMYSPDSYDAPAPRYSANTSFESQISRAAGGTGAVLRNPTLSSQYPGETSNPFRMSEPLSVGSEEHQAYNAEPEEYPTSSVSAALLTGPARNLQGRGFSLSDNGPVPGPGGVRRVSRPISKTPRPTSTTPPNQNRYSRGSSYNLPPGAAPPQPSGYGGYN